MAEAKTYALFVGANNQTKEVEIEKLRGIVDARFKGYTVVDSLGRWEGVNEKSVVVLISTDDELAVNRVVTDVKINLEQQAVGVLELPAIRFA